jgi:GT2 family glycosyltransferase
MVEEPRVGVVILSWNQLEKARACIASLLKSQGSPPRILLWDNGSTDGTVAAISEAFPEVIVHRHPVNLGVARGRNEAADMAIEIFDTTHLLFLDNDLIVEPGFIDALLKPFMADPKVGQTQAKLRFLNDRARLNDGGGCQISFLWGRTTPVGYGEVDRGQHDRQQPCIACGGAMMVRMDLFRRLGGFDLQFNPFGPEDIDFSLRLTKSGYDALYVPEALAYHEVSHSIGKGYEPEYARAKARNWLNFMRRHATLGQMVGFFMIGLPWRAITLVVREVRRGNAGAIRGIFRGIVDSFR